MNKPFTPPVDRAVEVSGPKPQAVAEAARGGNSRGRAIFTDSDEKRWFRDAPEDDVLPMDHPAMRKAFQRLKDAELVEHSRIQNQLARENRNGR